MSLISKLRSVCSTKVNPPPTLDDLLSTFQGKQLSYFPLNNPKGFDSDFDAFRVYSDRCTASDLKREVNLERMRIVNKIAMAIAFGITLFVLPPIVVFYAICIGIMAELIVAEILFERKISAVQKEILHAKSLLTQISMYKSHVPKIQKWANQYFMLDANKSLNFKQLFLVIDAYFHMLPIQQAFIGVGAYFSHLKLNIAGSKFKFPDWVLSFEDGKKPSVIQTILLITMPSDSTAQEKKFAVTDTAQWLTIFKKSDFKEILQSKLFYQWLQEHGVDVQPIGKDRMQLLIEEYQDFLILNSHADQVFKKYQALLSKELPNNPLQVPPEMNTIQAYLTNNNAIAAAKKNPPARLHLQILGYK